MIRAALLVLAASPAAAQERWEWGMGVKSFAEIAQGTEGALADVIVGNEMTSGHGDELTFPLSLGGLTVNMLVMQGPGIAPDSYIALPPEGYAAVPSEVVVDEGQTATIRIYATPGV